ncbi:MAG: hypothetical protein C5B49_02850 [Bdellovibrio sp.]|nr:MAG: hypothetical protein C5B49_02850 [Bdellovibrio sp.]
MLDRHLPILTASELLNKDPFVLNKSGVVRPLGVGMVFVSQFTKYRVVFLVVFWACAHNLSAPFCQASEQERQERKVVEFLNLQPAIRFYFRNDGNGVGHMAMTALMIKRLRDLGCHVKMELVYRIFPNELSPATRLLEVLLPPFSEGGGPDQYLPDLDLWVRGFTLNQRPSAFIPLIIGAHGDEPSEWNSQHTLIISPPFWSSSAVHDGHSWQKMGGMHVNYPFRYSTRDPPNLRTFLSDQMSHVSRFQRKVDGLFGILNAVNSGHVDMVTAYGWGEKAYDERDRKFVTLIAGINQAKASRPDLFPKPIIVNLISNLNDEEVEAINRLIHQEHELATRVKWIDTSDGKSLNKALVGLKPEPHASLEDQAQILIARTGSVPQDVWNYAFSRSTLPATVAGVNGFNFLAQRGEPFIVTYNDPRLAENLSIEPILAHLSTLQHALKNGYVGSVAEHYIQSRLEGSLTRRIFLEFARKLDGLPDKLVANLLEYEHRFGRKPEIGPKISSCSTVNQSMRRGH